MNEMIERYVYDVTRRLPENESGEIRRELEASIADMIPDNPSKKDIVDVLSKLGAPRILAEKYREKPRYLISPAMFDNYIFVLKTVTTIVAIVCGCLGAAFALSSGSITKIITSVLAMAFEGALQTALWITLGFAIAEKFGYKQEWKPEYLPQLPTGIKIPRTSSVISMIMSVFFSILFIFMIIREDFLFIFVRGADIITPISQAALKRFIPYIIMLGILHLVVNGFKLYWAKWNIPLCIINAIYNVIWASVILYTLNWPDLINPEFQKFITTLADEVDILRYAGANILTITLSCVVILIASIDIFTGIYNTWKSARQPT